MIVDQIDQLQIQYTDKYVVVDADRPELARFRDVVGQVKTINKSGRALVEFGEYHLNIGWYDIDPSFLKVVDKPIPKPKKPAAGEPASAGGKAAAKPAAAKPQAKSAPGGKMSVADMLAAARGDKAADKPQATPAPAAKVSTPTPAPAQADAPKMTVEQMLAAARAGKTAVAPPPAAAPAAVKEPASEVAAATGDASGAPPAAEQPTAVAEQAATGKVDRSTMSVADMIAWCREHDTK